VKRIALLTALFLSARPASPDLRIETPSEFEAPAAGVTTLIVNAAHVPDGRLEIDSLPGFPVWITSVQPATGVSLAAPPGPVTSWRRLALNVPPKRDMVVTVTWVRVVE
jgi:hypothetical protein